MAQDETKSKLSLRVGEANPDSAWITNEATGNDVALLRRDLERGKERLNDFDWQELINIIHGALIFRDEGVAGFNKWWRDEGSAMSPFPSEDVEQHARRVSLIAWLNGGYTAARQERTRDADALTTEKPAAAARREYLRALNERKVQLYSQQQWWKAHMPPGDEHGAGVIRALNILIGNTAELIRKIEHNLMTPPPLLPSLDRCQICGLGAANHGEGWELAKRVIPALSDVPAHEFIPETRVARAG